ncbi:hypothetical protein AURDEDRAFT_116921 [Auricularia subglabra TFB-10046 SS5]|nr:hypothetical protein AURDEDRAFT_116921 [Auricularia subglabra TFB-10046 SS5]
MPTWGARLTPAQPSPGCGGRHALVLPVPAERHGSWATRAPAGLRDGSTTRPCTRSMR